ncbi:MAG: ABC transporter ATP-binding protein/permease [Clostridia bacterium]|nr:ABC transporter ATP-binding protein/permease [Clostridia bacterium]
MLELQGISRVYDTGSQKVEALKGVSVRFRQNEFVSVLGPSGCGKTTLLNIIGGLDRATEGELIISGRSTRRFRDRDWDSYRNHAIGFVFQSYNLIGHQSVLSNVEMALTLAGVSKKERRERAKHALERVGLGDQLSKRPRELSGGQMQRVAIARALVNDPKILLADEPTGALDSETGLQVMELLAEIAKDRLVIMVTHNPELAEKYSTRIVRLSDGRIVGDTDPYDGADEQEGSLSTSRTGMSFLTALGLSLNNLLTKKTRTILVAFAGSIGIIGIALILAMSTGVQRYIDKIERETLTSYPLTLQSESMDLNSLSENMTVDVEAEQREEGRIYSGRILRGMLGLMLNEVKQNDLAAFKEHIDSDPEFGKLVSGVSYEYSSQLNIWRNTPEGPLQVNPSTTYEDLMADAQSTDVPESFAQMYAMGTMASSYSSNAQSVFTQLLDNRELLDSQYDVVAGRWPEDKTEVVLLLNRSGVISDYTLYTLGIKSRSELKQLVNDMMNGTEEKGDTVSYSYEEIMDITFRVVIPGNYYEKSGGHWVSVLDDPEKLQKVVDEGLELKIVGIVMPSEGSVVGASTGRIGYLPELMEYAITMANDSEIVKDQLANPEMDVIRAMPFEKTEFDIDKVDLTGYETFVSGVRVLLGDEKLNEIIRSVVPTVGSGKSLEENLISFGAADLSIPDKINIYPKDFESKELIGKYIDAYNESNTGGGKTITYTDYVGLLLSGVTDIVQAVTYVLVAFVAVSLFVSSIMIGVITYISVLERTKEIGILRALGASKRDIRRVFDAETLIIGFMAGMLGILVSLLLILPINRIIYNLAGMHNMAYLPVTSCAALVLISMFLTLIAGLIPSGFAARRDPVVALRSE